MITISDNDLKQLLLYVQATTAVAANGARNNLRMYNRIRLAKNTAYKLLKRADVQRVMSRGSGVVVAEK